MPRAEERLAPSSGSIWGGQTRACGGDGVTLFHKHSKGREKHSSQISMKLQQSSLSSLFLPTVPTLNLAQETVKQKTLENSIFQKQPYITLVGLKFLSINLNRRNNLEGKNPATSVLRAWYGERRHCLVSVIHTWQFSKANA